MRGVATSLEREIREAERLLAEERELDDELTRLDRWLELSAMDAAAAESDAADTTPASNDTDLLPFPETAPNEQASGVRLIGWAGSRALMDTGWPSAVLATVASDVEYVSPVRGMVARGKNGTKVALDGSELVVREAEGEKPVVLVVSGAVKIADAARENRVAPGDPLFIADGPFVVKAMWAREGKAGDLAPRQVTADRLGVASVQGPEYSLKGP